MKTKLSQFKFRSSSQDRVTDNRAQWYLRMDDYQRANSPRQRRLDAERKLVLACYHEAVSTILGAIILAILTILIFFFA